MPATKGCELGCSREADRAGADDRNRKSNQVDRRPAAGRTCCGRDRCQVHERTFWRDVLDRVMAAVVTPLQQFSWR